MRCALVGDVVPRRAFRDRQLGENSLPDKPQWWGSDSFPLTSVLSGSRTGRGNYRGRSR